MKQFNEKKECHSGFATLAVFSSIGGLIFLGVAVFGSLQLLSTLQNPQKFSNKIDCMMETGNQCAYLRCDVGCTFTSKGWAPAVPNRSFNPSSQLLFQKVERSGPCPEPGSCKATTTLYFDGRITKNGSNAGSVSDEIVNAVANSIKNKGTKDDCSYQTKMDVSTQYRFPHANIPSDGYLRTDECGEFEKIEQKIENQTDQDRTGTERKTTKKEGSSENKLPQSVETNFISYADVHISEKEDGKREYDLTSGVANEIPEQDNWKQKLLEARPSESYYNLVKVYEDGRKESIPATIKFCPPSTDVCKNITSNIDSVTKSNKSARLSTLPIEMTSAVQRIEFTAGGEVVDTMERPPSPPEITSFTISNPNVLGAQSSRLADIMREENRETNQTSGTTSDQRDQQNTDSNESKKVRISVKPSETNNLNGSLRYLQKSDEWELATIFERDNATSTVDFDYKITPDRISSEFENIDFKSEFTDGFYLVQAKKDDLVQVDKQPPEFELSLVREVHFTPQQSKSRAYLRAPFVIKVHDFEDPILGRSDTIPEKYEITWQSDSLPLDEIGSSTRSEYYTGLKINIPKEREYNSLMGKHTVTLSLEEKDGSRSATRSITFELVSLAEACNSKEESVLSSRIRCPRTEPAE